LKKKQMLINTGERLVGIALPTTTIVNALADD
jgi:hypothetical protein